MTLYEIDAAMQECIDPETGEVDAERIEALAMERDKKIENIALWIINIKADIETAKAEIDRLRRTGVAGAVGHGTTNDALLTICPITHVNRRANERYCQICFYGMFGVGQSHLAVAASVVSET